MNRIFLLLATTLIGFVVYGFYISLFEFNLIPNRKKESQISQLFNDYKVSLNVYTNLSSGSGSKSSISEEAKKVRLNFVLISDNNSFYDLDQDEYINDVGMLTGLKIQNENSSYIYYSPDNKKTPPSSLTIFTKNTDKSLLIQSHPVKGNFNLDELKQTDVDGIEIINFKNITQKSWQRSRLSTIWSLVYYPFNPRLALMRLYREPEEELSVFDQVSQIKKTNLFLGAEATARAIPFADWLVKFPSYESSFQIGSQHVFLNSELTGDITSDAKKIFTALQDGRSYIAFDALGDASGFETLFTSNKNTYYTGDSILLANDSSLYYKLPAEPSSFYEVVLYRNGKRHDHRNAHEGFFKIDTAGVYRIQVRLSPSFPLPDAVKWVSWIYTNNYYVFSEK